MDERYTFDISISINENLVFGRSETLHLTEAANEVARKAICWDVRERDFGFFNGFPDCHFLIEGDTPWFQSMAHARRVHAKLRR